MHDKENDATTRVSFDPSKSRRRTIYLPLRRSNLPTFFALFDFGDAVSTGGSRTRSNVATQALFMLNSTFVEERARGWAKYLLSEKDINDVRRIERAFWTALTRRPHGSGDQRSPGAH